MEIKTKFNYEDKVMFLTSENIMGLDVKQMNGQFFIIEGEVVEIEIKPKKGSKKNSNEWEVSYLLEVTGGQEFLVKEEFLFTDLESLTKLCENTDPIKFKKQPK